MVEKEDDKNYACLAAHLTTADTVKNILSALKEQAIEAIILKGLYLATTVYDDLGRQPGSDIDLLVKRCDLLRAQAVLNQLGWCAPEGVLVSLINHNDASAMNSLMFFNSGSLVSVHLHWHIINSTWPLGRYVKRINMEEIWQAAPSSVLEGVSIKGLSPEHLAIYLCYHGFTHSFAKPVYVEDINAALACFETNINWDGLFAQADKWGLRWMVDYCLEYVKKPRICKYQHVYWQYFAHEPGFKGKALFLCRTFFPSRGVMAALCGLPIEAIGLKHYWKRLSRW